MQRKGGGKLLKSNWNFLLDSFWHFFSKHRSPLPLANPLPTLTHWTVSSSFAVSGVKALAIFFLLNLPTCVTTMQGCQPPTSSNIEN